MNKNSSDVKNDTSSSWCKSAAPDVTGPKKMELWDRCAVTCWNFPLPKKWKMEKATLIFCVVTEDTVITYNHVKGSRDVNGLQNIFHGCTIF